MKSLATQPAMMRERKHYTPRRVAFWNRDTGQLVSDHGDGTTVPPGSPLSWVLALCGKIKPALRPRVLYVMGGERAATRPRVEWWAEPITAGWQYQGYEMAAERQRDGTHNAGEYKRIAGDGSECVIDVRMSAIWFGDATDPFTAREAWNTLCDWLGSLLRNDPWATLLTTPAQTGADLFKRWLPAGKSPTGRSEFLPIEYPPIPADIAETLRRNIGQGRLEFCPAPELAGATVAGLYWLDATWMYASCCRWLPVGEPTRTTYGMLGADHVEAYLPFVPAFYRVRCFVPEEWRHLGLIPQLRRDGGDGSEWLAEPGAEIEEAWIGGAELDIAMKAGWRFSVYERIAWPDYKDVPGNDPAEDWIRRLRNLRTQAEALPGSSSRLIASAIRAMQIGTVGIWAAKQGQRLAILPVGETPPAGAKWHHTDRRQGLVHWYVPQPLPKATASLARPELSATVWTRARAKVNEAALAFPREDVAAYRSDAIVLVRRPDGWPTHALPGEFRIKEQVPGPLVMPATAEGMLALRRMWYAELAKGA